MTKEEVIQESTEFEEIDFIQEHKKMPVTLDLTLDALLEISESLEYLRQEIINMDLSFSNTNKLLDIVNDIVMKVKKNVKDKNPASSLLGCGREERE